MSPAKKTSKPRRRPARKAAEAKKTPSRPLPGDTSPEAEIAAMIRVDQAGEFGALQIYKGQLAVLGGRASAATVAEMAAAEAEHLDTFDRLLVERGVRPTVLAPLWRAAGFMLGAGTALLGERHAMLCTAAVEEVIDEHYRAQADALGSREPELKATIETFRADEIGHRDTAYAHGAAEAPGARPLGHAIRTGTRLAIWLSKRI